jgi:hypothetical protein
MLLLWYENIIFGDPDSQKAMASLMINLMRARPRINFSGLFAFFHHAFFVLILISCV